MAVSAKIQERLTLARTIAVEAGNHTLQFFRGPELAVDRKGDDSPVTVADREAEQLLRKRILEAYPADAIMGEEFGAQEGTSGFRWILDPIDGTKSFISGVPLYGTLIGVTHKNQPQIGVIYIPGLQELVYAAIGGGAWYVWGDNEPQPARVSKKKTLSEGLFLTSQVDTFSGRGAEEVYQKLEKAAWLTRTWGDCYGYLQVAVGRAEVMVDPEMHLWDCASLLPILQEAGGSFTNWQGVPTIEGGEGIGANKEVLEEVLAITRPFARS